MKDKENKCENMQKFSVEIKKLARDLAFANTCFDCSEESLAEYLIDLGCRKLPKDSVVLSKEECKILLDNNIRADLEYWEDMLAKERKETAEKIYYKAEKKAYFKDGGYYDKDRYYIDMEDLKEILKQFGVEIKE